MSIETSFGPMRVCDGHVHFFSHRFFAGLAAQRGVNVSALEGLLEWQSPPQDPAALASTWAEELDRNGVDRAVLIASVPGDHESVTTAVASHPGKFFGYMMVNPLAPDCAEHIRAAIASGHMHGVCFFPAMHRYSMHDERVAELLDSINATAPRTVIFVHCGVLSVGVRRKLGLPSLFDMRFSNPLDLHGIALEHPELHFVVPHFGAGMFREALMLCDLCRNVYLDTSSSNSWMRYQEAELDLKSVLRRAIEVAGARRLIFGTDSSFFPRGWNAGIFKSQVQALHEIGVSADQAQLIFHGNLMRLIGDAQKSASS